MGTDPYMDLAVLKIDSDEKNFLLKELDRQILDDGAHFELSPMYHCIILSKILD